MLQAGAEHSIANSSLFPTSLYLQSNSTQILALKKMVFLKKFFLQFFFFLKKLKKVEKPFLFRAKNATVTT